MRLLDTLNALRLADLLEVLGGTLIGSLGASAQVLNYLGVSRGLVEEKRDLLSGEALLGRRRQLSCSSANGLNQKRTLVSMK